MSNDAPHPDNQQTLETDPRFPSGPWTGFWIQRRHGRQKMSLSLSFMNGRVFGTGRDMIGCFDFSGSYDVKTGRVQMSKQYEGAHRVAYEGANQGDGQWLWGVWKMRIDSGGFHMWPESEEDPTQRGLRAEEEVPTPVRLKKGELVEGVV
jgi:hypothetical protein